VGTGAGKEKDGHHKEIHDHLEPLHIFKERCYRCTHSRKSRAISIVISKATGRNARLAAEILQRSI
jgi:hypothetical protein